MGLALQGGAQAEWDMPAILVSLEEQQIPAFHLGCHQNPVMAR